MDHLIEKISREALTSRRDILDSEGLTSLPSGVGQDHSGYFPTEILLIILRFAIDVHPAPWSILAASGRFYRLASPLLYTHPRFTSKRALAAFSAARPIRRPQTVTVVLLEDMFNRGRLNALRDMLARWLTVPPPQGAAISNFQPPSGNERLPLDEFELCMSTSYDSGDDMTLSALGLVKCGLTRSFTWDVIH